MKRQKSGYLLIDALLCFMIASMLVILLARTSIAKNRVERFIKNLDQQLEEDELEWWQESNGGCRDTCLIDKLVYPWN